MRFVESVNSNLQTGSDLFQLVQTVKRGKYHVGYSRLYTIPNLYDSSVEHKKTHWDILLNFFFCFTEESKSNSLEMSKWVKKCK